MTSADRVFTVLRKQVPDRIPIMELSIDKKVIKDLNFRNYFEMVDKLDLDTVIVNQVIDSRGVVDWISKDKKIYKDFWGIVRRETEESIPVPIEGPIQSLEDLIQYSPPDAKDDPILKAIPNVVKRYKGKKAIVLCSRAVFYNSWALRGFEDYLMDLLLNPELPKKIGHMVVDYYKDLHSLAIRAGVDIIVLGDDYAYKTGSMMSPANFREFIFPGLREVVENIKREGAFCIKHTDGNILDIIEQIVESGIDCLGPLEPIPVPGMDLAEIKKRFNSICVMGNVDIDLLSRGSEDEVRSVTKKLIELVSPGGRYILSSGNSVCSSVRPENFRAMIETAREFGIY